MKREGEDCNYSVGLTVQGFMEITGAGEARSLLLPSNEGSERRNLNKGEIDSWTGEAHTLASCAEVLRASMYLASDD